MLTDVGGSIGVHTVSGLVLGQTGFAAGAVGRVEYK